MLRGWGPRGRGPWGCRLGGAGGAHSAAPGALHPSYAHSRMLACLQVVEMLMQRGGTDVCCTSDADATRAARLEGMRSGE